jgi:uncharacterized protein
MYENYESRTFFDLRVRQEVDVPPRLEGYAVRWGARSLELGLDRGSTFVEFFRRGAFTRTLNERSHDIRAFYGHDQNRILGRQSNGRLRLQENAEGLWVVIMPPPDTQDGRDVITNVQNRNLDGMSIGFRLYERETGERWDPYAKPPLREILEAQLLEVSIVAMPAYPDTSVAVRNWQQARRRTIPELEAAMQARATNWPLTKGNRVR